ncbi:MAG: phosphonopyruvate decarboxylase [Sedimenticola sp.]
MIEASTFVTAALGHGFRLYSGVPCSYLKPLINYVIGSEELRYVGAANEGDAVAVAAGAHLGGQRSVVILQNSGLGNAVSPLTSLTYTFRIPVLLIPTLRGEPGGAPDEPQHALMGRVTTQLLDLMEIPWEAFPSEPGEVEPALARAVEHMEQTGRPYALVMHKGSVAATGLHRQETREMPVVTPAENNAACSTRQEILRALQDTLAPDDVVLATTGYTGRELYACGDRPNQFYMVGSMGCVASLGLGLALARPERRIIVLDGDGAALMRLGAFCTLGHERPPKLVHIVLDNGMHESTGGQATVSPTVNFTALAAAAGYPRVCSVTTGDGLRTELNQRTPALSFVHVPITPGIPDELPRPDLAPVEVAQRLRNFLEDDSSAVG